MRGFRKLYKKEVEQRHSFSDQFAITINVGRMDRDEALRFCDSIRMLAVEFRKEVDPTLLVSTHIGS